MNARREQPETGTEVLVEEYPLRRAALDRAESERLLAEEVAAAISRGVTWDRVGQILDMPAGQARDRYGERRRAS